MRILITGATGFLGRNLIRLLLKENHTVTAIGRSMEKLKDCFPIDTIYKRVTDYSVESLTNLLENQEVVIHLASQLMQRDTDPVKISSFSSNLQIVENLVFACNKNETPNLIHTSTINVYPLMKDLQETQTPAPTTIYGVSKSKIDIYLSYIQKKISTKIISLRLARLYGYGERDGLMFTDFVNKARNKETLTINGQGKSTIEYIYIEDAIEAISNVAKNHEIEGAFNVGTGTSYSVKVIAETVNQVFENEGNVAYLADKPDGIIGSEMNVSKIKTDLNWSVKWNLLQSVQDIKRNIENEE